MTKSLWQRSSAFSNTDSRHPFVNRREDEAPGGMPLFRVDLAEIEGLEEEGSVVVHEGDGPKGLARCVCDRLSHGYSCILVMLCVGAWCCGWTGCLTVAGLVGCVRAALKYHREKRDEDCVPDGSGKAVSGAQIRYL